LDALTNYITGVGYDAAGNSSDEYKKLWPADVHVIGKDIVRFHTIYWPIFLMAMGEPLPKKVFGHPWLLQDGDKMSKSRGNVMYADDMVKFYGVDPLRYFLLSQMPFDNDGVISWDIVTDSVNGDLANVYGNLVSRTVAMSQKYFDGVIENAGVEEDVDADLKAVVTSAYQKVAEKVDQYRIADAMQEIMHIFRRANKYIDETMPWALAKDEAKKDRLKTVLYNLAETIVIGTTLIENAMPTLAKEVYAQFGASARKVEDLGKFGLLANGTKVVPSEKKLFTRLVNKEINEKVEAMYAERQQATATKEVKEEVKAPEEPKKETITIDTFAKVELKVGKVIACEKLAKSNKLLKSTVEIGEETRTILSGIAKYYTPEEMVGKLVVVVTNLAPAKLCGTISEGMLLCASDKDGKVVLLTPEQIVSSGASIS
ncbi:MAG: methionine--tRNA ligase subunit beta, partial [Clostridia bacterium]|nr:methionine--tRNA ligase subunit beta [Clostridia bacterium]